MLEDTFLTYMLKIRGFTPSCTCAKSLPCICSPLKHFILSINFVCGDQRPWSDCADAQADLGFRCQHVLEDTFLTFMLKMRRFTSSCTWAKSLPCICSPLKHSIGLLSINSVCGQRRPWSDCADAHSHADLVLCCLHMPEDTFLHAQFIFYKCTCGESYLYA